MHVQLYEEKLLTIDTPTSLMRVGEVADKLKVSTRTIKYYEELGRLKERSAGGFRLYGEREEIGHAEELLQDLQHDVALCKDRIREVEIS